MLRFYYDEVNLNKIEMDTAHLANPEQEVFQGWVSADF